MFTGLVEKVLRVESVSSAPGGARRIVIDFAPLGETPALGESVSISGACLTVSALDGAKASFDAVEETASLTTLGNLKAKDEVNIERALKFGGRLGGHFVSGHVDGVGVVRSVRKTGTQTLFEVEAQPDIIQYIMKKGSVAVDGVSLTVVEITGNNFKFAAIPHTLSATTLGKKSAGSQVNIEADMLLKYVRQLLGSATKSGGVNENFLKEHGFLE
jgi:riboflavin synthase